MDVSLFVHACRAEFINAAQTMRGALDHDPAVPFECDDDIEVRVWIRDIHDDIVGDKRREFIDKVRERFARLPNFQWDRQRLCWFLGDIYYGVNIRFLSDAGTPASDKNRMFHLWVTFAIRPIPKPEEFPEDVLPRRPAAEEPVEIEIGSFAASLAASMGEGASLTPRRFNREGGFSDN